MPIMAMGSTPSDSEDLMLALAFPFEVAEGMLNCFRYVLNGKLLV